MTQTGKAKQLEYTKDTNRTSTETADPFPRPAKRQRVKDDSTKALSVRSRAVEAVEGGQTDGTDAEDEVVWNCEPSRKKEPVVLIEKSSSRASQEESKCPSPVNLNDKPSAKEAAQSRGRHIWFDDDGADPALDEARYEDPKNDTVDEVSRSGSEDEAPEEQTLSAAQAIDKELRRGEAKAALVYVFLMSHSYYLLLLRLHRQATARRQKRREVQQRLQEQAKSQKRKREPEPEAKQVLESSAARLHVEPMHNALDPDSIPTRERQAPSGKLIVPDLLPEEILAAEPYVRPPTPPLNPALRPTSFKKHTIFAVEEKRPKDVKRGGVMVRVLDSNNPRLAPKAGRASRALREQWLLGRTGKGGTQVFERRKAGKGFLRR